MSAMNKEGLTQMIPIRKLQECDSPQRFVELTEKFYSKFGHSPEFYSRAPGRVNIIGEHIDYCGYAVLPMAISQDIIIAAAVNETGKLNLINLDKQYKDFECDINNFEIIAEKPTWYKYVLCGVKGIKEDSKVNGSSTLHLGGLDGIEEDGRVNGSSALHLRGLDLAVVGSIPPSSGLSSSSALVCGSAMAVAYSHKLNLSKEYLAELCAKCERYIGTHGGGMDQAISLLANKGTAKLIEFNPLRSTPVTLPEGATFVVANSLAPMNKAATSHFNHRVMECKLACQVIAKQNGLEWHKLTRLADLQKVLEKTLLEMVEFVKMQLHQQSYSKEEICSILETSPEELNAITLSENTYHIENFKLYDRAYHVFSEAHRVLEFKRVCEANPSNSLEVLQNLGCIMDASHLSTRYSYECSHPKLDTLVDLSKGVAMGTRLTGAGWGGCVVALVSENRVAEYMQLLKEEFYQKEKLADNKDVETFLFSTPPSDGACIYLP